MAFEEVALFPLEKDEIAFMPPDDPRLLYRAQWITCLCRVRRSQKFRLRILHEEVLMQKQGGIFQATFLPNQS